MYWPMSCAPPRRPAEAPRRREQVAVGNSRLGEVLRVVGNDVSPRRGRGRVEVLLRRGIGVDHGEQATHVVGVRAVVEVTEALRAVQVCACHVVDVGLVGLAKGLYQIRVDFPEGFPAPVHIEQVLVVLACIGVERVHGLPGPLGVVRGLGEQLSGGGAVVGPVVLVDVADEVFVRRVAVHAGECVVHCDRVVRRRR